MRCNSSSYSLKDESCLFDSPGPLVTCSGNQLNNDESDLHDFLVY